MKVKRFLLTFFLLLCAIFSLLLFTQITNTNQRRNDEEAVSGEFLNEFREEFGGKPTKKKPNDRRRTAAASASNWRNRGKPKEWANGMKTRHFQQSQQRQQRQDLLDSAIEEEAMVLAEERNTRFLDRGHPIIGLDRGYPISLDRDPPLLDLGPPVMLEDHGRPNLGRGRRPIILVDHGSQKLDLNGPKQDLIINRPTKLDPNDRKFDLNRPKLDLSVHPNLDRRIPPNLDVIQPKSPTGTLGNSPCTIVTALLDIGRGNWSEYRRPYTMYLDYMDRLLSLDIHLVVFTDPEGAAFVRKHRRERMDKTSIQEITLRQLPLYAHYDRIKGIIDREQANWKPEWDPSMRYHPESTSAEYDILMNSKPYFVYYVANWNPYRSQYFYWLDAGYGHGQAQYPPMGTRWAPENIMTPAAEGGGGGGGGKVTFIKLGPVELKSIDLKEMYRQGATVVNGGFFGGDAPAIGEYFHLHNRIFEDLLNNRQYVDDDQTLTVLCYQQKPELFNMVVGDWYDVFRLFHPPGPGNQR